MKNYTRTAKILIAAVFTYSTQTTAANTHSQNIQALRQNIENATTTYTDLTELTSQIGARPSGSHAAAQAVEWAAAKMRGYGFDRVIKQPVTVPHWVRGNIEKASLLTANSSVELKIAALGLSAGTRGLDAEVIEVQSLDQARQLGPRARGKIIFFNRPMDASLTDTFEAYGGAVDQRSSGPTIASGLGAVAVLVRSLSTLPDDDHPHTGITRFRNVPAIPAAAISTHGANVLSQTLRTDPHARVHMELSASTQPDVTSYNVIGEITGGSLPGEIVLVGAHLDSWDLGTGAHDDGTGVAQTLDVCRAIKQTGLIPKRTIRCVLFMTEEFGGIGADQYAEISAREGLRHTVAVESDRGGFDPDRFDVAGTPAQITALQNWLPYLSPTGIQSIVLGEAGTDVSPLAEQGTLTIDFVPVSTHYFDLHHSALDQIEAVDPIALRKGSEALTSLIFLSADADGIGM